MRRTLQTLLLLTALLALATPVLRAEEPRAPLARVKVKEEGFYRVTPDALARLGVASAEDVEVRRGGRPVPRSRAEGEQGLVFLAEGHATDHSAWGVYEIWPLGAGAPAAAAGHDPDADATPAAAHARRVSAPDHLHGPLAAGRPEVYDHPEAPTWFLALVPPGQQTVVDLDPMGALPRTPQTLDATVWANRIGEVALHAWWGEQDLGIARGPTAAGGAVFRWEVPADAVPSEGTALRLRDVSPPPPPPPPQDVSSHRGSLWVDALSLSGPVQPVVDAHLRVFDLDPGTTLELEVRPVPGGPPGPPHWAVVAHDGAAVPRAAVGTTTGDASRLEVSTGSEAHGPRLFASTRARDVEPVPAAPADPLARAGDARHVILAVPALLEPSRALARQRRAQGLSSAVVPVQEVYDVYGHGEAVPEAIRAFLVALMRRPNAPLDYVLLAGDATLDRTDFLDAPTIPTPMARTIYNGATSADRLYALPADGSQVGGPAIGRLPFREAAPMAAYLDRVIAYETHPPADPSRRLMRFVTNEARFGPLVDRLIEAMFRGIVSTYIPPAYDMEITYASPDSPYLWPPPEFGDKVVDAFNDGCLFLTYLGHGFADGFDSLHVGEKRFPILYKDAAGRIACHGTPPTVFVIACTTAIFDRPANEGVGEALMARPQGPVAYWGATRICHPAANGLYGRAIARYMSAEEGRWRLGDILARARDDLLDPGDDPQRRLLDLALRGLAKGASPERLALEGTWMYSLLGDPALKIAVPASDVRVEATIAATAKRPLAATIQAPLPDGTVMHLSLEVTRTRTAHDAVPVADPLDPASFETIRENHERVNDLALVREDVTLEGGRAAWTLPELPPTDASKLVVKAWTIANGDVHQGAVVLEVPAPPKEEKQEPEKGQDEKDAGGD